MGDVLLNLVLLALNVCLLRTTESRVSRWVLGVGVVASATAVVLSVVRVVA